MSAQKKRVLICYTKLAHYRIPIFERLAAYYDLTIVHSGERCTSADSCFEEIVLPVRRVGRFHYQTGLWSVIRRNRYEAVIFFLDLAWISIVLSFLFCPGIQRRITWGLWRTGRRIPNLVRLCSALYAHANVFYSVGAAQEFLTLGVPNNKIYVARNTVKVESPYRREGGCRNTLLFVGSFDRRKRNDVAITAFSDIVNLIPSQIKLVFVGDGSDKETARGLARSRNVSDRIEFHPATTDDQTLRLFYSNAIASFSFGQAGLSVLQSLGHGVPFITCRKAVSGGEIENIRHNYNGILCDNDIEGLKTAFVKVCTDCDFVSQLGLNAKEHYHKYCDEYNMVNGFRSAIEGIPQQLPSSVWEE